MEKKMSKPFIYLAYGLSISFFVFSTFGFYFYIEAYPDLIMLIIISNLLLLLILNLIRAIKIKVVTGMTDIAYDEKYPFIFWSVFFLVCVMLIIVVLIFIFALIHVIGGS